MSFDVHLRASTAHVAVPEGAPTTGAQDQAVQSTPPQGVVAVEKPDPAFIGGLGRASARRNTGAPGSAAAHLRALAPFAISVERMNEVAALLVTKPSQGAVKLRQLQQDPVQRGGLSGSANTLSTKLFWKKSAAALRTDYAAALARLAQAAPGAVLADGRPLLAFALQFGIVHAQSQKDAATVQRLAEALATQFPNDPLARWAQTLSVAG